MVGYAPRRPLGVLDNINDWMEQRHADLRRLEQGAEAVGRKAWAEATRAGQNLAAQTPAEVKALGLRAMQSAPRRSAPPAALAPSRHSAATNPPPSDGRTGGGPQWLRESTDQTLAGMRGAQDAFTMGLGDRAYSGVRAAFDAADGQNFLTAYPNRMERERARDRYDDAHYKVSRAVGQVLGTGAQLAALGPLEGVVPVGARIAQASKVLWNERGALAGAGAVGGIGTQIVADELTGHRSSVPDLAASGIGGAAGAVTSLSGGASRAGAVDGAVTSMAQDLFHGRLPSVQRATEGASMGGALGAVAGRAGRAWSDGLDNRAKGRLGEFLSQFRTAARGDHTEPWSWSPEYLPSGRKTIPDSRSYRGKTPREIIESKFGRGIKPLRGGQREAAEVLPNYRVDHWRPEDIGVMFGFPSFAFGEAFKASQPPPDVSS